jgi:hypothetical protein
VTVVQPIVQPNMLDDLGTYLEEQFGVGAIWLGRLPEDPAACIAMFEMPGLAPIRTQDGLAAAVLCPELQVIVRGEPEDYQHTRGVAQSVHDYLGLVSNTQIGANFYLNVLPMRAPALIQWDILLRPLIEVNFAVQMRRPPAV